MREVFIKIIISAMIALLMIIPVMSACSGGEHIMNEVKLEVSVESANTGNIFFDGDKQAFNITIFNKTEFSEKINVKYVVFELNSAPIRKLYSSKVKNFVIKGNSDIRAAFDPDVKKYGLYILRVEISCDSSNYSTYEEIPFSRCVLNNRLNKDLGVAVHFSQGRDPYTGAELIAKAGMGTLKDELMWIRNEASPGNFKLHERDAEIIDACIRYGIEPLMILGYNNQRYDTSLGSNHGSKYLVADDHIDDYVNYIRALMNEPLVRDNVKMYEIWNEPNNAKFIGGDISVEGDYKVKAEQYSKILLSAYNAVKESNPNATVAGFSIAGMRSENSRKWIDYALDALGGTRCFDILSVHSYTAAKRPEGPAGSNARDIIADVAYYSDLLDGRTAGQITRNTYNYGGQYERWHTEFGWSTAAGDAVNCIGDDNKQAAWAIRQYTLVKGYSIKDKLWFYDFTNDGNDINEWQHNYGMLKSAEYSTPYAAKPAYLAVSNLNRLTAGASACLPVIHDEVNGRYIYKFTCSEDDVYVMWAADEQNEQKIQYDFERPVTAFMDLYGNVINAEEINISGDMYRLTETPVYAVCKQK